MKFGMNEQEAAEQPSRGGSGAFMKYPKPGANTIRILDEPGDWKYYWEHFNPGGFSFPCTNDRDNCPGCTSDDEKMKKASQKVSFNAFDGQYTNVWKFPKLSVGDKLKARFERIGTVMDRDYLITQIKTANSTEYDVEGLDKEPFDFDSVKEFKQDPEVLLASAYEEAWGDDTKTRTVTQTSEKSRPSIQRSSPPVEEKVVTEDELRKMDPWELVKLCEDEGFGVPPKDVSGTADTLVDWMLSQ